MDSPSTSRETVRERAESLEDETRQAKEQLAELGRTATEYSTMIQKKEERIAELTADLENVKQEHEKDAKEILELCADIDTLQGQLDAEKKDHALDVSAKDKLQDELDELRALLATKASEETRRSEAEKSKELELFDLRNQHSKVQHELTELRQSTLEAQNRMKVDLEQTVREYSSLQHSHTSLLARERAAQSQLTKVQAQLAELEKAKRALDSDLLAVKSRQHETQDQLADALRGKEVWI